jgi:hypothetical protein
MDTTIDHKGSEIVLLFNGDGHDFISLPGTIRHKIPDEPGDGAKERMRNRRRNELPALRTIEIVGMQRVKFD